MKRFRLHGKAANWVNGLRMSALNLATLTEETSSPIPSDARMFVHVANGVVHVDDARREILTREICESDKNIILAQLQNNTPDFLLTLDDKVVGYANLVSRKSGMRTNEPPLPQEVRDELADLESAYENSADMTDEEYRDEKRKIILGFIGFIVKPTDTEILVNTENIAPKHSFKKDGLTEEQRDEVYDFIQDFFFDFFDDWNESIETANSILDEVVENITETADWEDYAKDEINEDDVRMSLRRVVYSHLAK